MPGLNNRRSLFRKLLRTFRPERVPEDVLSQKEKLHLAGWLAGGIIVLLGVGLTWVFS